MASTVLLRVRAKTDPSEAPRDLLVPDASRCEIHPASKILGPLYCASNFELFPDIEHSMGSLGF